MFAVYELLILLFSINVKERLSGSPLANFLQFESLLSLEEPVPAPSGLGQEELIALIDERISQALEGRKMLPDVS